jgi:hypothetical protein
MGRKLATLAGLLSLGLLAWAAAPALSLSPYVPEPVEFEQPLPELSDLDPGAQARRAARAGHGHDDERLVRYLSPLIEAPHRFDAVGVAGELGPYELRVRESGGEWSPWTETGDGSPVWSGGADELQLRSRTQQLEGSLHYVNVTGTATAADRALTALRGTVNSAFVQVASVTPAAAKAPKPDIRGRSDWDPGDDCPPRTGPVYGEVDAAAVHHTVTANDYSASEVAGMIRSICLYHRNGNGWNDIGYNAVVDRYGRVWEGRDGGLGRPVVGAHTQGYNAQTTGVAMLGDHRSTPITHDALKGLARFLAWKLSRHGTEAFGHTTLISAGGEVNRYPSGARVWVKRIFGHRRTNLTECPGDALDDELGKVRRRTQRRIDAHSGEPPPPPDGGVPN